MVPFLVFSRTIQPSVEGRGVTKFRKIEHLDRSLAHAGKRSFIEILRI